MARRYWSCKFDSRFYTKVAPIEKMETFYKTFFKKMSSRTKLNAVSRYDICFC